MLAHCELCDETKAQSLFAPDRRTKSGYGPICAECREFDRIDARWGARLKREVQAVARRDQHTRAMATAALRVRERVLHTLTADRILELIDQDHDALVAKAKAAVAARTGISRARVPRELAEAKALHLAVKRKLNHEQHP